MYEFLDYFEHPEYPLPDVLLAPSTWHLEKVKEKFGKDCLVDYIPVPVNREVIARRKIKKARTFVHIAGYDLYEDRNGTKIFLEALQYITTKAKIKIYTQHDLGDPGGLIPSNIYPKHIEVINRNVTNYWDLYKTGDVMVMPRRYGGLCLPLNEAMAAGMIPIMPNIDPQVQFLHNQTLTPVRGRKPLPAKAPGIFAYDIDPQSLAYHIDLLFVGDHGKIESLSDYSDSYAQVISWDSLKDFYLALFENILK
jgi:hypothetical protein